MKTAILKVGISAALLLGGIKAGAQLNNCPVCPSGDDTMRTDFQGVPWGGAVPGLTGGDFVAGVTSVGTQALYVSVGTSSLTNCIQAFGNNTNGNIGNGLCYVTDNLKDGSIMYDGPQDCYGENVISGSTYACVSHPK
jgi:hypothetical protein